MANKKIQVSGNLQTAKYENVPQMFGWIKNMFHPKSSVTK